MTGITWLAAWPAEAGAERAAAGFERAFYAAPTGVWAAPGRVNIIGEHVDYNGGRCLPMALPHRTYVALRPRMDGIVRCESAQIDGRWQASLHGVAPGTVSGWGTYAAGVAWALRLAGAHVRGFDAYIDSCVPFGAGLSSSAALEGAVAVALDEVTGWGWADDDAGRTQLAAACVRAENQIAGAPTGGMDQAVALRAQAGCALLLDSRDGAAEQVPFDLAAQGLAIVVIDTRARHANADGQYGARRAACEQAARLLGVASLREIADTGEREAALATLTAAGRRDLVPPVQHVLGEMARTDAFTRLLRQGRLDAAGPLLRASHLSLRDNYRVSCPELDAAVEAALGAGALGARMIGGGFGGSAIALVRAGQAGAVADAVAAAFAGAGFDPPAFLEALPSSGASRVA